MALMALPDFSKVLPESAKGVAGTSVVDGKKAALRLEGGPRNEDYFAS